MGRIQNRFSWDGSWRDLYILDIEIADWQRFIDFLKSSRYPIEFYFEGEKTSLPEKAGTIFQSTGQGVALLTIDIDGMSVNCHFFHDKEIEMDIDPREVTDASKAESLFEFMREIAEMLRKPMRMTPENMSGTVIFEYEPYKGTLRYERDTRYNE